MILATAEPKPALKLTAADGSPQPLSKTGPYHPNRISHCALRSDDTEADWAEVASVDHTDARKATVRRFVRSDRSAHGSGGNAEGIGLRDLLLDGSEFAGNCVRVRQDLAAGHRRSR